MKNFEEILRDIPSAGTKYKTNASPMIHSTHGGYSFYTEDFEENGGIFNSDPETMALPPPGTTVDTSISEALMKLSINDRNAIEEEVHGIVRDTEETPNFLEWCLRKFDKELMTVKNCKKRSRRMEQEGIQDVLKNVIRTVHDFACLEESSHSESTTGTNNPLHSPSDPVGPMGNGSGEIFNGNPKSSCYVNDPDVRLRFVRAEQYDCEKAVKRFVNFLDFSQELFGDFVADRPIRLSDLSTRKEKWTLSNVSFQFLPFRDRSGRRVFVSVGTCGYDIEPIPRIKVLWYMNWIASEDIESQQKGVVMVGWPSDSVTPQFDDDTNSGTGTDTSADTDINIWEGGLRQKMINLEGIYQVKALDGLPLRIAALHMCFEDRPIYRLLNSLFHFTMNPYLKSRYKVHIGEPMEIRYELQGYGIPTDSLPLTHTMAIKRQNHTQWIALRKRIERNLGDDGKKNTSKPLPIDQNDIVECPRSFDVIIGKAKYKNNPGNVFYRSLIEATHDEHIASSKREKVELTWRIVRQMEERKGRFLEMNKSVKAFVHIKDRNVMRQKVAQSYKEYKRNAGVIRSTKRNLHEQQAAVGSPKITIKRQRTVATTMFNEDCFSGCFNTFNCDDDDGFLITPDEQSSDLIVSRSIFTSLW